MIRKKLYLPVDTQRRYNVDTTSCDIARRRIDVETVSSVYWAVAGKNIYKPIVNVRLLMKLFNVKITM